MFFSTFKLRLRLKRYALFLAIGMYVVVFLFMINYTKPDERTSTSPHIDSIKIMLNLIATTSEPVNISYSPITAVLVLVCNRPSVTRTLDQLLKYRPNPQRFPLVLSQDCGEKGRPITKLTRKKYGSKLTYLTHPHYEQKRTLLEDVAEHMKGYYSLSAHYNWALNYTFDKLGFDNVIVVEDDLDISSDFFEYFQSTLPLLYKDNSLWCISAYNDNGKRDLVDMKSPFLLYRTDFFPGLGWMLARNIWNELAGKWPAAFWDDWMRKPEQRKGRACVHPEVSRTKTFGRFGVSNGQFFDEHLDSIQLNPTFMPFTSFNLSYLLKNEYDSMFMRQVEASIPVNSTKDLEENIIRNASDSQKTYQLSYKDQSDFKTIAERIGIMGDFKSGIPRGGYKGIVPVMFKHRRVYLVPSKMNN